LRHETVERAKPGDRCVLTGTLIVVPDVSVFYRSGVQLKSNNSMGRSRDGYSAEGVTGLKSLGVRDLTYKLVFLASTVQAADARVRNDDRMHRW
jgi:DNA replication licensing factor MCM6